MNASINPVSLKAQAVHNTNKYGIFNIYIFENIKSKEIIVLTKGDILEHKDVPCRVQSECLPGTVLDSADCDCSEQIALSLKHINDAGIGIFVLLRQEGRGHGLAIKIRALANKNKGMDTFQAVEELGLKADIRNYDDVIHVLNYFKIKSINILSNSPEKTKLISNTGVVVSNQTLVQATITENTRKHLLAKKNRGHFLEVE